MKKTLTTDPAQITPEPNDRGPHEIHIVVKGPM